MKIRENNMSIRENNMKKINHSRLRNEKKNLIRNNSIIFFNRITHIIVHI